MAKRDLLIEAADAVADRLYPGPKSYCLGTIKDVIVCLPPEQLPKNFKLIAKFRGHLLEGGLSGTAWTYLHELLIKHFEKEKLCLNHQTH